MRHINASIVQGSGLGPVAYVLNASDLHPADPSNNSLNKYADDSYLIVPPDKSALIPEELSHICKWAETNNLSLNVNKTKEMIVRKPRGHPENPPPVPGVERVNSMNILGVTFSNDFTFHEQVKKLKNTCAQNAFAIRTLRAHGLKGPNLWQVTHSTLISRLTYASPAWWGLLDAGDKIQLEAAFRKVYKQGLVSPTLKTLSEICNASDSALFASILGNKQHVLHKLLPPVKVTNHFLRKRAHNRVIPADKDGLLRKTFIFRMLHLDSY